MQRTERRKPLASRQVRERFHRHARAANPPLDVTPHGARAILITEVLDRKCLIEAVEASVGPRYIVTTPMDDQRKTG